MHVTDKRKENWNHKENSTAYYSRKALAMEKKITTAEQK